QQAAYKRASELYKHDVLRCDENRQNEPLAGAAARARKEARARLRRLVETRAVWAADCLIGNQCKAIRAFLRLRLFLSGLFRLAMGRDRLARTGDRLHQEEHRQGHDQEADDVADEQPVVDRRRTGCLSFGKGGVALARQVDVVLREIHLPQDGTERSHDDVVDERVDDAVKRRPDDDTNSQVDDIATKRKVTELFPHQTYAPHPTTAELT